MVLLHLNCHVVNYFASLKISLPYQAVYQYLLDNPVSGLLFVPTIIAALYPSNRLWAPVMGIKRFDHETKVKARSERRNLQTAS